MTAMENAGGRFSVAIHHLESGEAFQYDADQPCYAASVIKVPIMATVFHEAAVGHLTLEEKLIVREEDMVTGSGVLQHLTPGIALSIRDLVVLMIIESDNTATNLLIDRLGTQTIQQSMQQWGLQATQFHHKLQIIPAVDTDAHNTITAREMAIFLKRMAQGQVVSWNACRKMIEIMKWQKVNTGLPSLLPVEDRPVGAIPDWELAHKTGDVTGIEHDVGLLYVPGHTFAIAVCVRDVTVPLRVHAAMGRIGRILYDAARHT
ncbi:MAG: serine hydrolase [Firmicutes bacterium]|nr:serine hydrolase [Bacillota bacterium]